MFYLRVRTKNSRRDVVSRRVPRFRVESSRVRPSVIVFYKSIANSKTTDFFHCVSKHTSTTLFYIFNIVSTRLYLDTFKMNSKNISEPPQKKARTFPLSTAKTTSINEAVLSSRDFDFQKRSSAFSKRIHR